MIKIMEYNVICVCCRTRLLTQRFVKQWVKYSSIQALPRQYPAHVPFTRQRSTSRPPTVRKLDKRFVEDEGLAQEMKSPLPLKPIDELLIKSPSSATSELHPTVEKRLLEDLEGKDELWTQQQTEWRKLPRIYLRLSKYKLSALVVLTALAGYTMAPAPLMTDTLFFGCVGTALCSASANTMNQWMEVPFDSQMARTRNRVLVRHQISPLHAVSFGTICGITGSSILFLGVNSLTAGLGILNILLYTCLYTPMKRVSILNTWVGSIVGAVPPLMGWAACSGTLTMGSLIMSGVLYAWQFPHFNALSWGLRADYSRGGYRMMSVTNPDLCRRVAFRYCIGLIPICSLAPVAGLTTWWFAIDSLPLNLWFTYLGWNFYNDPNFKSARKLFQFSLFHLPLIMILLILNKRDWTK